jgi:succinate-semialdehyde dehydrogenase/glutarate-semialdehyde dehydrogenase
MLRDPELQLYVAGEWRANDRRLAAIETLVADARAKGARVVAGGSGIGNRGYFHELTVLADAPDDARAMHEEPFGLLALLSPVKTLDDAIDKANSLPYGLAAYAYTRSAKTAQAVAAAVETGMISINHHGLALPEVPFGGVKDSGYGSEGGSEAIEAYLNTKFVSQAAL